MLDIRGRCRAAWVLWSGGCSHSRKIQDRRRVEQSARRLVFIAGVVLLFTGRDPTSMFDLALGIDRWAHRVAATR